MLVSRRREFDATWRIAVFGLVVTCAAVRQAEAHKGPPFPLLMDQSVANCSVSVWADPDIGDALFYIVVETPSGETREQAPHVSMWTEPISGRLARVKYDATRQDLRNRLQFAARPYFDQGEMWNVGFRIEPVGGDGGELVAQVESTPPGYGLWDFAIYLFPFVLFAGMWIVAIARRVRAARHIQNIRTLPRREDARLETALSGTGERDWK